MCLNARAMYVALVTLGSNGTVRSGQDSAQELGADKTGHAVLIAKVHLLDSPDS